MSTSKSDSKTKKSPLPVPERDEKGHFLSSGKSESAKKATRKTTQAGIIAAIRKRVEEKLKKDAKATLGDYIRLVQLQKDLEDGDVKEIRVTWVEPTKTESGPLGE